MEEEGAEGSESPRTSLSKRELEEKVDSVAAEIRNKETELRQLNSKQPPDVEATLGSLRRQREEKLAARKALDDELRAVNKLAQKQMDLVSQFQIQLRYKREDKIDDAVRRLEHQLQTTNFNLRDEKKIVAEIDSLRRSKHVLRQYNTSKREHDGLKEKQRIMREKLDYYAKEARSLKQREEDLRKTAASNDNLRNQLTTELEQLRIQKQILGAEVREVEKSQQAARQAAKLKQREERERAREKKDSTDVREVKDEHAPSPRNPPYHEEVQLCTALIGYLQPYVCQSPRDDDTPDQSEGAVKDAATAGPGPEEGLVLLKRRGEEGEDRYSGSGLKRERSKKRAKKRKSTLKSLSHNPETLSQFERLKISPPVNSVDVLNAADKLQTKKAELLSLQDEALQSLRSTRASTVDLRAPASLSPRGGLGASLDTAALRARKADQGLRDRHRLSDSEAGPLGSKWGAIYRTKVDSSESLAEDTGDILAAQISGELEGAVGGETRDLSEANPSDFEVATSGETRTFSGVVALDSKGSEVLQLTPGNLENGRKEGLNTLMASLKVDIGNPENVQSSAESSLLVRSVRQVDSVSESKESLDREVGDVVSDLNVSSLSVGASNNPVVSVGSRDFKVPIAVQSSSQLLCDSDEMIVNSDNVKDQSDVPSEGQSDVRLENEGGADKLIDRTDESDVKLCKSDENVNDRIPQSSGDSVPENPSSSVTNGVKSTNERSHLPVVLSASYSAKLQKNLESSTFDE